MSQENNTIKDELNKPLAELKKDLKRRGKLKAQIKLLLVELNRIEYNLPKKEQEVEVLLRRSVGLLTCQEINDFYLDDHPIKNEINNGNEGEAAGILSKLNTITEDEISF